MSCVSIVSPLSVQGRVWCDITRCLDLVNGRFGNSLYSLVYHGIPKTSIMDNSGVTANVKSIDAITRSSCRDMSYTRGSYTDSMEGTEGSQMDEATSIDLQIPVHVLNDTVQKPVTSEHDTSDLRYVASGSILYQNLHVPMSYLGNENTTTGQDGLHIPATRKRDDNRGYR